MLDGRRRPSTAALARRSSCAARGGVGRCRSKAEDHRPARGSQACQSPCASTGAVNSQQELLTARQVPVEGRPGGRGAPVTFPSLVRAGPGPRRAARRCRQAVIVEKCCQEALERAPALRPTRPGNLEPDNRLRGRTVRHRVGVPPPGTRHRTPGFPLGKSLPPFLPLSHPCLVTSSSSSCTSPTISSSLCKWTEGSCNMQIKVSQRFEGAIPPSANLTSWPTGETRSESAGRSGCPPPKLTCSGKRRRPAARHTPLQAWMPAAAASATWQTCLPSLWMTPRAPQPYKSCILASGAAAVHVALSVPASAHAAYSPHPLSTSCGVQALWRHVVVQGACHDDSMQRL